MIDDCDMLGTRPPVLSIEIVLLASMLSNFGGIFGGKGIELVRASLLPIFLEGLRFLIDVVAGHDGSTARQPITSPRRRFCYKAEPCA